MKTDWLGKLGVQLILDDPFWGWLYGKLPRSVDEKIEDVCLVATQPAGLSLHLHPRAEKKGQDLIFLSNIKHELLHFLLEHPVQRMHAGKKEYFDLASDLCVDQFLEPYPGRLSIHDFPHMRLHPFQSAQEYYARFLDLLEEGLPDQVEKLHTYLSARQSEQLKHQYWVAADEASAQDFEGIFSSMRKDWLDRSEIRWPVHLKDLFLENHTPMPDSVLNWKDQLHWLVRTSIRTRPVFKKNRLSRRYGVPPGIKIERTHRLLVAVDTSGSVREEELRLFFHEIHRLHQQGVEIELLECDASIQKRYPYAGRLPDFIRGRGDTNYQPPIEMLNREPEFGGLIYFTDGDGPSPFITPQRPVLWIISRGGADRLDRFQGWPGRKAIIGGM